MSSQYSVHLQNRAIMGRVQSLSPELSSAVAYVTVEGNESVLYVPNDRLREVSDVFYTVARELGLLALGVE